MDPDLVMHLTFDGDIRRDELGHLVNCGDCPTPALDRSGGGAAAFTGAQCLVVSDAPELRPSEFTLATWVTVGRSDVSGTIVGKALDGPTGQSNSYELFQDASPSSWCVAGVGVITCNGSLGAGWHHLAATYDGADIALYVDGLEVSRRVGGSLRYADDPIRVGCDMDFGVVESFYMGEIDDVRLYRRVLSREDIDALAR